MRATKIKKVMLICLLAILWLPFIQMKFKIFDVKPLDGAIVEEPKPYINKNDWYDESYQTQYEKYINQNFGFRNTLVRLNNQFYYDFFQVAKANGVLIGKENYLYEENYIKAYLGLDFIGREKIHAKVDKLKKVSDTLRKLNKHIIIVFAPGKGTYFPEYFPSSYDGMQPGITNYEVYRKAIEKEKLNFIDFNKWFLSKKESTPYPLFPKAGIHWSKYGEFLAADSLTRYISSIINKEMPKLILREIKLKETNEPDDYDIGAAMNLYSQLPVYPMAYPEWQIDTSSSGNSSKVLVVSDSFYWGLFSRGFSKSVFGDGAFWYYNETIHPSENLPSDRVADYDIKEEVEKNDVVVIICTDANLSRFAFGFIDRLYDSYYIDKGQEALEKKKYRERTLHYIHAIKSTPEWLEAVRKQAKERKISLEDCIRENAEYMVKEEMKK